MSLKILQNKNLIEMDNGKYQIYDSIFRQWLKKEYEDSGIYLFNLYYTLKAISQLYQRHVVLYLF